MKEYLKNLTNEMIKLYNKVLIISNNKLKIDLEKKYKELISHKDKLINLNLSKIISDDDLKNKLTKNENDISKIILQAFIYNVFLFSFMLLPFCHVKKPI